ncbi:MAG: hypothetical protein J7K66_06745, partial [Anaerolineaceae bacterium]|nr:hypothetical protein [Anaerolineaceae bacterium]
MKFTFDNIPEICGFSVFDYDNKEGTGKSWEIPVGSLEFDYEIPEEWTSPHYSLNALKYYI